MKFSVAMVRDLTHDDVAPAQHLDDDLAKFFRSLSHQLSDTIVFFMTDFGVSPPEVRAPDRQH